MLSEPLIGTIALIASAGLIFFAVAVTAALMWLRRRRASRRALETRVAELEVLSNAVNRIASAALNEEALCHLVYECAAQLVDVSNFQLGLFDGDDYVLRRAAFTGGAATRGAL